MLTRVWNFLIFIIENEVYRPTRDIQVVSNRIEIYSMGSYEIVGTLGYSKDKLPKEYYDNVGI